jgi:hypothetical protein
MSWHNARAVPWKERADRHEHNMRQRARYRENPEAGAAKLRAWRAKNPEAQKAIERRHREKNGDTLRARNKEWREENRQLAAAISQRVYYETRFKTPWREIVRSAFRRALDKGLPFSLTNDWAKKTWTGRCALTDIPFELTNSKSGFYSPSIDQIDAGVGYTPENSRFVLFSINGFKSNGTDEDMIKAAKCLISHQKLAPDKL